MMHKTQMWISLSVSPKGREEEACKEHGYVYGYGYVWLCHFRLPATRK